MIYYGYVLIGSLFSFRRKNILASLNEYTIYLSTVFTINSVWLIFHTITPEYFSIPDISVNGVSIFSFQGN